MIYILSFIQKRRKNKWYSIQNQKEKKENTIVFYGQKKWKTQKSCWFLDNKIDRERDKRKSGMWKRHYFSNNNNSRRLTQAWFCFYFCSLYNTNYIKLKQKQNKSMWIRIQERTSTKHGINFHTLHSSKFLIKIYIPKSLNKLIKSR